MHRTSHTLALAATTLALAGCPEAPHFPDVTDVTDVADAPLTTDAADAQPAVPAAVRMDFARRDGFYATPFPGEDRRRADGHVDVTGFPNVRNTEFVRTMLAVVNGDADGFGTSSGVFFQLTAPIDPSGLPDLRASVTPAASVYLVSVDPSSPDHGQRQPITTRFTADPGPFGAPNFLALLPFQGRPLRPRTLYAAVVLRTLRDPAGAALLPSPAMATLIAGQRPEGMPESTYAIYRDALADLRTAGTDLAQIAGLTVFRTGSPALELAAARDTALARPLPAPTRPFARAEVFPDYCVYATTVRMPVYQSGTPPYNEGGGGWARDPSGALVFQREEEANLVVTVPRRAMPAAGFPMAVLVRTGAGGERPLVDRGVHATEHGEAITPGSGPAMEFARVGFAGASVDGPHGGLRNVTHADEQFLIFNITNPLAMRDNVRQSALELMILPGILAAARIDASDCAGVTTPDAGPVRFDTGTLALMGHSMGGTIAPLTVAHDARYRALVLSGAGGSWIENVMHKLRPLAVRGIAETIVGYGGTRYRLNAHDPVLSLLQWAGEPADPQVYARYVVREPVAGDGANVLMLQGIVDHYIMPPIANGLSVALGLDLGGAMLDRGHAELTMFTPLGDVLDLGGGRALTLPIEGNVMGRNARMLTSLVTQHASDGIEDGHEAAFQTEEPKRQYRCFLQSFARGVPRVGATSESCP